MFATVRWIPSEFKISDAGLGRYDRFYDAGHSVLAGLEEKHMRDTKHRISSGSSQDPFTTQRAPLHPSSCRGADAAIVVVQDSPMNDAGPLPKKKLGLKETASHDRVMCFPAKASAVIGTKISAIPTKLDEILWLHVTTPSRVRTPQFWSTHHDHPPHTMQSQTTLKRRSSRTQQRNFENLPTSLQTLANNERSFHSS